MNPFPIVFLSVVWTLVGVMWYRSFVMPELKGRIALRTINRLLKNLGYEVNQYNHINETSIYPDDNNIFRKIDENFSELSQRIAILESKNSKVAVPKIVKKE